MLDELPYLPPRHRHHATAVSSSVTLEMGHQNVTLVFGIPQDTIMEQQGEVKSAHFVVSLDDETVDQREGESRKLQSSMLQRLRYKLELEQEYGSDRKQRWSNTGKTIEQRFALAWLITRHQDLDPTPSSGQTWGSMNCR